MIFEFHLPIVWRGWRRSTLGGHKVEGAEAIMNKLALLLAASLSFGPSVSEGSPPSDRMKLPTASGWGI